MTRVSNSDETAVDKPHTVDPVLDNRDNEVASILNLYRHHQRYRDPKKEDTIESILYESESQISLANIANDITETHSTKTHTSKASSAPRNMTDILNFLSQKYYDLVNRRQWNYGAPAFALLLLTIIMLNIGYSPKPQNTRSNQFNTSILLENADTFAAEIYIPLPSTFGFTTSTATNKKPFLLGVLSIDLPILNKANQYQKLYDANSILSKVSKDLGLVSTHNLVSNFLKTSRHDTKINNNDIVSMINTLKLELVGLQQQHHYQLGQWIENTLLACEFALINSNDKLLKYLVKYGTKNYPNESFTLFSTLQTHIVKTNKATVLENTFKHFASKEPLLKADLRKLRKKLQSFKAGMT